MKLFVHIPKTGGTSFRWALDKYFTKSQVIRDYGPDALQTSDIISEHLYAASGTMCVDKLMKAMSESHVKILVGHFPLQKYARYFKPQEIITIVRNPLIRVCSEYLHRTRNQSFSGSFSEFIRTPAFQNIQSRVLDGISTDSMVGITQHYDESLRRLNNVFGWNLKILRKNVGRKKGGRRFADNLTTQERSLFYKMNEQDMELYQNTVRRFTEREGVNSNRMAK